MVGEELEMVVELWELGGLGWGRAEHPGFVKDVAWSPSSSPP